VDIKLYNNSYIHLTFGLKLFTCFDKRGGGGSTIIKINSFSNILLLMVLFPYISLFRTPFDTQPFVLIWSVLLFLILFVRKKSLSLPYLLWVIFFIFLLTRRAEYHGYARGYLGSPDMGNNLAVKVCYGLGSGNH